MYYQLKYKKIKFKTSFSKLRLKATFNLFEYKVRTLDFGTKYNEEISFQFEKQQLTRVNQTSKTSTRLKYFNATSISKIRMEL